MCTHLAAANEYKLEHLQQPHVWNLVEKAKAFYIGAYHLTVCVPAIIAIAKEASSKNKVRNVSVHDSGTLLFPRTIKKVERSSNHNLQPLIIGLAAPFIPTFFKDQLAQVFPYTDYVLGNEQEAVAWAETQGLKTRSIPEIAQKMSDMPKENTKRSRTVVITQGTEPTIVAVTGAAKVDEHPVHAIKKEQINDTNGAGYGVQDLTATVALLTTRSDAFAGGFCSGIIGGKTMSECVDRGQWLARLSIQELGPS